MALLPLISADDLQLEQVPLALYEAKPIADGRHEEIVNQPFSVEVGVDRFTLSCDRSAFPETDTKVIKCRAEASYDGGKTWELLAAFTTIGGVAIAPDGSVQPTSWISVPFKEQTNPNRMVRTSMVPIETVMTRMECVMHKS